MDLGIRGSSRWLVAAGLSLMLLGGCTPGATDEQQPVDAHRVPDVVGMTIFDACIEASREGFGIKVVRDVEGMSDACAGPAAVTDQSPAPGTTLKEGSLVTVHVSPTKTLPDG